MTTTTSTTTRDMIAATIAALSPLHARMDAPTIAYGRGVRFASALAAAASASARALRESRYLDAVHVLQQRADEAERPAVALAVTHYDAVARSADVLLWHPAYGDADAAGSWQDVVLTVNVDDMTGDNWHALDTVAIADTLAAAALAERAASESVLIPRSAAEARRRSTLLRMYGDAANARLLDDLAAWLPGGDMMARGHDLAANIQLCGEYEAAVCPTLGWSPRRGELNSRMRLTAIWQGDMDAIEASANGDAAAAIAAALARVERGGTVNTAICDHAHNYLERHKRPAVNELLAELGMDAIGVGIREFEVQVRVERTRVITEHTTVTVTVEASDEDEAGELATDDERGGYGDYLYGAYWIVDDNECETDVTDVYVEDVTEV